MAVGQVWTDVGQAQSVDLLDPATRAAVATTNHVGWGSSGTTPLVTDTVLGSANAEARTAATITQPAANQLQWAATITATGARTVQEVGVFDASTNGNMLVHAVHGSLTLASGSAVAYTITLTMKDSSE